MFGEDIPDYSVYIYIHTQVSSPLYLVRKCTVARRALYHYYYIGIIIYTYKPTCKGENALKTFITYIHHKQYKFHLLLLPGTVAEAFMAKLGGAEVAGARFPEIPTGIETFDIFPRFLYI